MLWRNTKWDKREEWLRSYFLRGAGVGYTHLHRGLRRRQQETQGYPGKRMPIRDNNAAKALRTDLHFSKLIFKTWVCLTHNVTFWVLGVQHSENSLNIKLCSHMWSCHLSPHNALTISLSIFPTLCLLFPWPIHSLTGSLYLPLFLTILLYICSFIGLKITTRLLSPPATIIRQTGIQGKLPISDCLSPKNVKPHPNSRS